MNQSSMLPSRRGPIHTPTPSRTWPLVAAIGVGGVLLLIAGGGTVAILMRSNGSTELHAGRAEASSEQPSPRMRTPRIDWPEAPRATVSDASRPTLTGEGIRLLELPIPPAPAIPEGPLAVEDDPRMRPAALPQRTEAELQAQLARVPEYTLLQASAVAGTMKSYGMVLGWYGGTPTDIGRNPHVESEINKLALGMLAEMQKTGLPVQTGRQAQLDAQGALVLQVTARQMRAGKAERFGPGMGRVLTLAVPGGTLGEELNGPKVRQMLQNWEQLHVQKDFNILPTIVQMLPVEDEESRGLLIAELSRSSRPEADTALAQRALYELSPNLRTAAVQALKGRDPERYRQVLLDGLRHPWAPIADHAAEALVELKDRAALSKLIDLLEAGDPAAPAFNEKTHRYEVRELVRINHLSNCFLCHAPSFSVADPTRGRDLLSETTHVFRVTDPPQQQLNVSITGGRKIGCKPPPPPAVVVGVYNQTRESREVKFTTSAYVRADTTYLRQDFSVMQKVDKPRRELPRERFDFLVRSREVPRESVPEAVLRRQALKTECAEPLDRRGQARSPGKELVLVVAKRRGDARDEVKGNLKPVGRGKPIEAAIGTNKPGRNLEQAVETVAIVKSLPRHELDRSAATHGVDEYPQRAAILHALRRLTGTDAGDRPTAWRRYLQSSEAGR